MTEKINNEIDNLIIMFKSKKFNSEIYAAGLQALKEKYNFIEEEKFSTLRKMIISYKVNPDKRNILSKAIIEEFNFLTD